MESSSLQTAEFTASAGVRFRFVLPGRRSVRHVGEDRTGRASGPPGGFRARISRPSGAACARDRQARPCGGGLETPDGDELVLDHIEGRPGAPRLLVLHGLEGSSYSVYVQGLLRDARRRGLGGDGDEFPLLRPRPRGTSRACCRIAGRGSTTRARPRTSTSSCGRWRPREPRRAAVRRGVSLGGNVLLKWLGENPAQRASRPPRRSRRRTTSPPAPGTRNGARPRCTSATSSRRSAARRSPRPRAFPRPQRRSTSDARWRARTFREFDDAATAPLHGFAGADDYYRRASSLGSFARDRDADAVSVGRGRSVPSARGSRAGRAAAASRGRLPRHAARRPHRVRVRAGRPGGRDTGRRSALSTWLARERLAGAKKRPESGLNAPPADANGSPESTTRALLAS